MSLCLYVCMFVLVTVCLGVSVCVLASVCVLLILPSDVFLRFCSFWRAFEAPRTYSSGLCTDLNLLTLACNVPQSFDNCNGK